MTETTYWNMRDDKHIFGFVTNPSFVFCSGDILYFNKYPSTEPIHLYL